MEKNYKSIDADKLLRLFNFADCIIIDVRTPLEYARGHIPQSLNIPLETLIKQPMLYLNLNYTYYIICKDGTRSARLVSNLIKQNYPVINILGGIEAWSGPLEKDRCFN